MLKDLYRPEYNRDGKLVAIYRISDGAQLRFNPSSRTFDEAHPLTIELRDQELDLGESLDLSDRPVNDLDLQSAIALKQQEIIAAAYEAQNELTAGYAVAEQTSWDRKLAEANKILNSEDINDAPILKEEAIVFSSATSETDTLAATLYLANAIKTKSDELYIASARIAGKRTLLWNQAAMASTIEDLQAIAW